MLQGVRKLLRMTQLESGRTGLETSSPNSRTHCLPTGRLRERSLLLGKRAEQSYNTHLAFRHPPTPHPRQSSPLGQPSLPFCNSAIVLIHWDPTVNLPFHAVFMNHPPPHVDVITYPNSRGPCCPLRSPGMCRQYADLATMCHPTDGHDWFCYWAFPGAASFPSVPSGLSVFSVKGQPSGERTLVQPWTF